MNWPCCLMLTLFILPSIEVQKIILPKVKGLPLSLLTLLYKTYNITRGARVYNIFLYVGIYSIYI